MLYLRWQVLFYICDEDSNQTPTINILMRHFLSHCENLIKGLVTCESKHCLNKAGVILPCAHYTPQAWEFSPTPNPHVAPCPLKAWAEESPAGLEQLSADSLLKLPDLWHHHLPHQRETRCRLNTQQKGRRYWDEPIKMSSVLPFTPGWTTCYCGL